MTRDDLTPAEQKMFDWMKELLTLLQPQGAAAEPANRIAKHQELTHEQTV